MSKLAQNILGYYEKKLTIILQIHNEVLHTRLLVDKPKEVPSFLTRHSPLFSCKPAPRKSPLCRDDTDKFSLRKPTD